MTDAFKKMADQQNIAAKGRSSQSTDAVVQAQKSQERDNLERRVKDNSNKDYLNQLSDEDSYKEHFDVQLEKSATIKKVIEENKKLKEELKKLKQKGCSPGQATPLGEKRSLEMSMDLEDNEDLSPGAPILKRPCSSPQMLGNA